MVTSLVFRTIPAPAVTVFHLTWPPAAAATVLQTWQAWAPDAPDELDVTLRLTAAGDSERPPGVVVVGSVLDGQHDATELLGELVDRVGVDPVAASRRHLPHRAAKRHLEGLGSVEDRRERSDPEQPPRPGHLYTKSEFFRGPLPAEAVAALVEHLTQGMVPGQSREVDFLPWGGAYNRVPADATAFVHRAERFLVQHLVQVGADAAAAERAPPAAGWTARGRWSIHGVPGVCTPTFRTRTSRTGRAPTTGPTSTACGASRRRTTRPGSSASTSHFPSRPSTMRTCRMRRWRRS